MANFDLDNLLTLEPSTISRDLSGYITYVYGAPKVGKTTLARDMGALIIACEDGTRALTGAYVQKAKNWSDIRALMRFCKDERMKARYKAIAFDTIDVCASFAEKYVCAQLDIQTLGEGGWAKNGWSVFKKELEEVFRTITMEGYAVLFISHDKTEEVTRPDGSKFTRIVPTAQSSLNNIIKNMADIIAYGYFDPMTQERYMMLRSLDGMVDVGCRFQYIEPKIPFGYKPLVDALNKAIDKEEEMGGTVVETKVREENKELDFDALMKEFNDIIANIPGSSDINQSTEEGKQFLEYWAPRITEITVKYLGTGKKVSQCTRAQVEQLSLIVDELSELIKNK
jgi:hypothetical protein